MGLGCVETVGSLSHNEHLGPSREPECGCYRARYAPIAVISGLTPMMFITRVRL